MKNTLSISEVLIALRPGAQWVTSITNSIDDDYETIEWHDEEQTKPSLAEIKEKYAEMLIEQPMSRLREYRNKLLSNSDWTQTPDIPETIKTPWAIYRQQLRDLPSVSNPILDDTWSHPSGVSNVVWPTSP